MTIFGDIVLPIVLFIIMMGIGLSTKLEDFNSLIRYPKAAILGIASQVVLLPAIALALSGILGYDDEMTLGLLLLSLCPSGTGSNIITKMLKGNLALSVSLTALSSVKSLVVIPLFIGAYLSVVGSSVELGALPYGELALSVFLLTILPTSLGLLIGVRYPMVVHATKKLLKWLLPGLLFGVFVAIMFLDDPKTEEVNITAMLLPALLFNLISMVASLLFVKAFQVENKQAIAITIEGGLKNSAIGLLIASQFLNLPNVELLILAYSFISFYLTFVIGLLFKKLL